MDALTGEIFIAWTNEDMAYAHDEEEAIEKLFEDGEVKPFRVARFTVQLPMIETTEGGTLSVSGARPTIKIVGGTDAS